MHTDPIAALVRAYAFRFCADPSLLARACAGTGAGFCASDEDDEDEGDCNDGPMLLARLLGLVLPQGADRKPTAMAAVVREHAQACVMPGPDETVISRNLQRVATALGLDAVEQEIVLLASLAHYQRDLGSLFNQAGRLTNQALATLFATLTGQGAEAIYTRLQQRSPLLESGLLSVYMKPLPFMGKVKPIERFYWRVAEEEQSVESIFDCYVRRASPATLTLADFTGYPAYIELLVPYLQAVTRQRRRGCNVLVYGRPGTGKSELVRAVAQHLGLVLWEALSAEDLESDYIHLGNANSQRTNGYALAQRLLERHEQALVLFDECEENIPKPVWLEHNSGQARQGKLWFNRLLENNPVPALWVCNNIQFIDPAYIRRFDLVLHIDQVPLATRQGIIRGTVQSLGVDDAWIQRVARASEVTPAHIQRASQVAQLCEAQAQQAQHVMEQQMRCSLVASGIRKPLEQRGGGAFDLRYCNADHDMGALSAALGQARFGRLCFHGQPGTGKTEFARYLADRLALPLVEKRASNLLGKYVGETEKNLAQAFLQAREDGAILLIDEADTFLADRSTAHQQWEVSQTNELLCQMETFDGLLIVTTNRFDSLDTAALRRFDFKVQFQCLKPEQVWEWFCECLQQPPVALAPFRAAVLALQAVTPGLFAIAARRQTLYSRVLSPQELLALLRAEAAHQRGWGDTRPIGFVPG